MALRGNGAELKYEFRVRPGADPADIRLAYHGATGLRRRRRRAADRHRRRRAARRAAGRLPGRRRAPVESRYAVDGRRLRLRGRQLRPAPRAGHRPRPRLLDVPRRLGARDGRGIAVDAAGNAYVTGFTQSPNFPTTAGAFDRTGAASNNLDVFVTKLNPAGTALVYSTFIGGTNFDWGRGDRGRQRRQRVRHRPDEVLELPDHGGAFDRIVQRRQLPALRDRPVRRVRRSSSTRPARRSSTRRSSAARHRRQPRHRDRRRAQRVRGRPDRSRATSRRRPARSTGPPNGSFDAFVTKLNATGSALVYSTRLGGEDNELPEAVKVDAGGNAYVGGSTRSTGFPTTARRVRHDPERRRVRRALRPVRDQAQPGRLRPRLLDVHRRLARATSATTSRSTRPATRTSSAGRCRRTSRRRRAFDPSSTAARLRAEAQPGRLGLVYSTFRSPERGAVAPDARRQRVARRRGGPDGPTRPTRSTRSSTAARSTRTSRSSTPPARRCVRELPRRLGVARRPTTSRSTRPATSTSPATRTRPTSPTTPGAFDRTWAGDPLIFWGDAFVAKVDADATAPPVAAAGARAGRAGARCRPPRARRGRRR